MNIGRTLGESFSGAATYLINVYLCHIIRHIRYETISFDLFGSTAGIGHMLLNQWVAAQRYE